MENSERDGNTRPPDLPLGKPICRSESKEELKSFMMKVKEENGKASLGLKIKKVKIITPGPITSWQIDGEAIESVTEYFL